MNYTIIKGSFGHSLNFAIKDADGNARDCTGYTAKLQVWSPLTPETLLLDAACVWIDDSAGTCSYTIPLATTFSAEGVYQYAIVLSVSTTISEPALFGFITVIQGGTGYCTLEEVKDEIGIENSDEDSKLQRVITNVTGLIDSYCHRSFNSVSDTRYFDGAGNALFIDDLISVTGEGESIKIDNGAGTWASTMAVTDYILYPLNTLPKTKLELSTYSNFGSFASGIKQGVKITGTWGYPSVPADIKAAALMWVVILWNARKAGYSKTIGNEAIGVITIDKDPPSEVKKILNPYRKIRWL